MPFIHKEYSQSVTVLNNGPRQYGIMNRSGKKFVRNYRRELKNGKGMSFLDVMTFRIGETHRKLSTEFENIFT